MRDTCSGRGTRLDSGSSVRIPLLCGLLGLIGSQVSAQYRLAEVTSIGQPPQWEFHAAPSVYNMHSNRWRGRLSVGVHKHLPHPVVGLLCFAAGGDCLVASVLYPG